MAGSAGAEARPGQTALAELKRSQSKLRTPDSRRLSTNITVERGREGLIDSGIRGILDRGVSSTPLNGGIEARTPIVDVPGKNGVGIEVVRTLGEAWTLAKGTHIQTRVQVWEHQPPTEQKTRGSSRRVLEVAADVASDGQLVNERVTYPHLLTAPDKDPGRTLEKALFKADDAVSVVEAGSNPDQVTVQYQLPEATEAERLAETRELRVLDYHVIDAHLREITDATTVTGERTQLRAYNDWLELREAEAESSLASIRARESATPQATTAREAARKRVKDAKQRIARALNSGATDRTLSPDIYRSEQHFLDDMAGSCAQAEFGILLAESMTQPSPESEQGEVQVVNIKALQAEARLRVVRTLRDRQAAIESGAPDASESRD